MPGGGEKTVQLDWRKNDSLRLIDAKRVLFAGLMLGMFTPGWSADESTADLHGVTEPNGFVVSVYSTLKPIAINRMHSWIVHINDRYGDPVDDAEIHVDAGMPEHNHGLPTTPQVTQRLGNGEYLLEGMRFHMNGWWQIAISFSVNNDEDSVVFDLHL